MNIFLNGKAHIVNEGVAIGMLLKERGVSYNLLLRNGFFANEKDVLQPDDEIYAIQKNQIPSEDIFFDIAAARQTPGVQKKLKSAKVAIAGVGGLGSNIAVMLCRCGIGHVRLIDFDIVDPTNLNRQNYYLRHIGLKKVVALKEILLDINPYIQVETRDVYITHDNAAEVLKDADIIVEAFDAAHNKSLLVNAVLSELEGIPVFSGNGMAGYGKSNDIQTILIGDRLYISGDMSSEAKPFNGLMAPRVSMVAAHQANAIIRYILGERTV